MESDGVSNVSDTASDDSGNQSDCASNQPENCFFNDQPDDEPDQDDTPTRPCRKKSGDSSSRGKEAVAESITEWTEAKLVEMAKSEERREKRVAAKLKREEAYIRHLTEIEKNGDLKILLQPHNNIDEPFKSIVLQCKREICEKWGWEMP
ncbi:hypothetical protein HanXRQr2_Chr17g0799321 [Helianthus annuus]|uniref:Uncharacterized protein n=1 Tax=Helianthus annuus TaxID=4232 RepID=A0A9K3DGW1_HELAN|nr:hypothetical protein HanXRQr2_Chr17g0799321 [Helianthus annuus]KAJ0812875.1 hypothetical protein HanPSC8_Chr17g0766921 [Helianthus annuus]